jgi:hypothetical protein
MSRGRLDARKGDMLGLLHDLLLSDEISVVDSCTHSMSHLPGKIVLRVFGGWKRTNVQFRKCNCSVLTGYPSLPVDLPLDYLLFIPLTTPCRPSLFDTVGM